MLGGVAKWGPIIRKCERHAQPQQRKSISNGRENCGENSEPKNVCVWLRHKKHEKFEENTQQHGRFQLMRTH